MGWLLAINFALMAYWFNFLKEPEAVGFCLAFSGMCIARALQRMTRVRDRD